MFRSTLCYLQNKGRTLLMRRDKKENDVNEGKWIGVGGKFEADETAGSCLKREVLEETGLDLSSYRFHGIINFKNDEYEDEEMYLYSSELTDEEASSVRTGDACREGYLDFIPDGKIFDLPLWEGDRFFLKDLLEKKARISYELDYEGGILVKHEKIPVRNILFDLDGTLIDTGEGIMKCAAHSLKEIGVETKDWRDLSFFVGPPLVYTYTKRYGVDMAKARELVKIYRERYNPIGVFEAEPYPGVIECLKRLKEAGCKLYVCSSKPENMCRILMEHFNMDGLFDDIAGSTPDGKIDTKTEVLNELFRRNSEPGDDFIASSVLIGDTRFDIAGANETGVSSIGVSFGYGDVKEMQALGACTIVNSMEEITSGLFDSL
ncbi:MAG: HAD hydrolase-like protein [Lachnospiraceae bacterium]|nr:HAD hydrolase-like protein [Lachnospiraceae bacterium]